MEPGNTSRRCNARCWTLSWANSIHSAFVKSHFSKTHFLFLHLSLVCLEGFQPKLCMHFLFPLALGSDWTIGVLGFDSRRGLRIFLFTTASRTALGPTQPPIRWVPVALSLGVKRPGREANHSPPSSGEVKECGELYIHPSNTSSWRGA
jgi:hypothetical protein